MRLLYKNIGKLIKRYFVPKSVLTWKPYFKDNFCWICIMLLNGVLLTRMLDVLLWKIKHESHKQLPENQIALFIPFCSQVMICKKLHLQKLHSAPNAAL